jgi:protein-disulfide isomerase
MAAKCRGWRSIPETMKRSLPFIIITLVFVGAVVTVLFLLRQSASKNQTNSSLLASNNSAVPASNAPAPDNSAPIAKPNVKVSSPVVVEEYGDYQCPPCGLLYPELKRIEEEYGNQVHLVFHHFPLAGIHKNAVASARAAEAARLQNKFWEMHDRLYRNQKAWADQADPRPIFISYARELGLNADQFQTDMDSNRVEQAIVADMQRGQSLGINSTPTLLIDGLQLRAQATTPEGIRRGINMMLERKAVS